MSLAHLAVKQLPAGEARPRSGLSVKRTRGRGLGKPGGFPSYQTAPQAHEL
jgi:hypothetical protein